MTSLTLLAVGLKPSAISDKGRLRGLLEPAQAGFVTVARGFSRRAIP